jgi:putative ABC transport system ATP-binding protein
MAVAADPTVVIADEPTAELDDAETDALIGFIPQLANLGQTFVLSSHDPIVLGIADTVLAIRAGNLVAQFESGGEFLAVIDDAGRVPLPDEALELFPDRRAKLTVAENEVRLRQP